MRSPQHRSQGGFTLLEMTLAIALSLGIAFVIIGILQQQISFSYTLSKFKFLREDAPQISTFITNLSGKSSSYRIYSDLEGAMNTRGAVRTNGRALRLRLPNPDGTAAIAIVVFEERQGKGHLNYYYRTPDQQSWSGVHSTTISTSPSLVDFSNDTGILLIKITGPNGEEITYGGDSD